MAQSFDIFTFLEEYKRFPCLWEKNSPEFKNRVKRDQAEKVLLPLAGLASVKELRQKIRSIRCTYNQEVAKIKKSMGIGSGRGDVYRPKLVWFSIADSFLQQTCRNNRAESNLSLPENVTEVKQEGEGSTQRCEESTSLVPMESPTTSAASVLKNQISSKRVGKYKVKDSLDQPVYVFKQVAERSQTFATNEFTIFGRHVASQLQCLPIEEAVILQENIQKLLTAARLRYIGGLKSCHSAITHLNDE